MDPMLDKEQEWLSSLIKESTKLHHARSFLYLKEFFNKSPEEILELRKKEGKRFTTRIVLFWKWLQTKDLAGIQPLHIALVQEPSSVILN